MTALRLFPVFVALLAVLSFLFGGAVSLWQWWTAFALAAGLGFIRRPWRDGMRGVAVLAVALAAAYLLAGVLISPGWRDEVWCHFPAVKFLAGGWNPLKVRTPEAFEAAFGFNVADMRLLHVIFQPKAVWIFNAAAGLFTGDFLCPMLPILVFLFPVTLAEVWYALRPSIAYRVLAAIVLYAVIPALACVVDAVVALAAIGLLTAMWTAVRRGEVRTVSMAVFTFWLCSAKGAGIAQALAYWLVFIGVVFFRRLPRRRIAGGLAVAAAAVSVACLSPFATSFADYGHPFYPNRTADAEKYPVVDLLDLHLFDWEGDSVGNGYVGTFVYAYVSPALSNAYYAWKAGRPGFQAKRNVNKQYPTHSRDLTVAVDPSVRIVFWFCLGVLVVWGSTAGRMLAGMILLSLLVMPYPLFGYLRYTPQFLSPILFVLVLAGDVERKTPRRCLLGVVWLSLCLLNPYNLARQLVDTAVCIRERAAMEWLLSQGRDNIPAEVFYPTEYTRAFVSLYFPERATLSGLEIRDLPEGRRTYRDYRALDRAPGGFFGYRRAPVFKDYEKRTRIYPGGDDHVSRLLYVGKTFLVMLPKALAGGLGRMAGVGVSSLKR